MRLLAQTSAFLLCLALIFAAGREGLSHLQSDYGRAFESITHVNAAVTLSPSNPEAYYARSSILASQGEFEEAAKELARAIEMRPRDYFLWLELGHAREQIDDRDGALIAFGAAVRLAPNYAQPRWQLGNLLLRSGQYEDGFRELKRAVSSDPTLLPAFIDLAWGVFKGDVNAAIKASAFESAEERLALMRALVQKKNITAALLLLRAGSPIAVADRKALVEELIRAERYPEAYELWSNQPRDQGFAAISNGDFEQEIVLGDPGFGWRVNPSDSVAFSLDAESPHSGDSSLRLDFSGNPEPSANLISQLVLVEPGAKYRLSFATRTSALVTAGPPLITVSAARKPAGRILGETDSTIQGMNDWRKFEFNFVAANTDAIVIALQRRKCRDAVCPIFGQMWLDKFFLKKL